MTFAEWIELELQKRHWTRSELSRRSGLSTAALSLLYSGQRNPGIELCHAISEAFGIPISVVLRAAGLLPPVPDTEEIIEMTLHEMGLMSTEDRQDMLEYARLRRRIAEERNKYE